MTSAVNNIDAITEVMTGDIVPLAKIYLEGEYEESSETTREMVAGLWECVRRSLELSVKAVGEDDQQAAQDVLLLKDNVRDFADRLFERHANRLRPDDSKYLQRVKLLMTFIEQLRHMYTLTKRMAKTQMASAVSGEAALA